VVGGDGEGGGADAAAGGEEAGHVHALWVMCLPQGRDIIRYRVPIQIGCDISNAHPCVARPQPLHTCKQSL
jgi:hypothetical protein